MSQVTELDDRIAKCNKILSENPNSQIFAALAEAFRKKGELDKAFRTCQIGLKIHPNYGSAHMVMAKINRDKGLYDWSEMEVFRAVELDGDNHATELLLAEICVHRGEFAKATRILNRLLSKNPNDQQATELLELAKKLPLESVEKPKGVIQKKAEPDSVESSQAPAKPAEKITLKQLLDFISELAGVDGVLLINSEGLVAEERWHDSQPPELYGAIARDIERTIQSQIEISRFGKYESILLEADDLIIHLLPLEENLLLVKANRQINLGTLRLKLSTLMSRLNIDFS